MNAGSAWIWSAVTIRDTNIQVHKCHPQLRLTYSIFMIFKKEKLFTMNRCIKMVLMGPGKIVMLCLSLALFAWNKA